MAPDAYRLERHPTFASHHVRTREGDGEGQFHMIWPSTKVNVWPGTRNLSIGPLAPLGRRRAALSVSLRTPLEGLEDGLALAI